MPGSGPADGSYLERAAWCKEHNPHFHNRSMERDRRCELCGVSER